MGTVTQGEELLLGRGDGRGLMERQVHPFRGFGAGSHC